MVAGCADTNKQSPTTQPLTADQRQAQVLQDPFGYGGDTEKVDITGGGIRDFDKKAFKRDMDAVFNP
jgi:hypothetical protein